MRLRFHLAIVGALFCSALGVRAQFVWTGAGSDNSFTTGANWQGGTAPTGSGSEDVIFGDVSTSRSLLPSALSLHNITFNGTNSLWFFDSSGSSVLTLTGDILTTSGSAYYGVFSNELSLATGTRHFDLQGSTIYLFGFLSGDGDLVKTGGAPLLVVGGENASTYTGNIDLQDGDIDVAGDGALGTGVLTMNGGRLLVATGYDSDNTVTLYNSLTLSSTAFFGDTDDSHPKNTLIVTGPVTIQGGVGNVDFNVANNTHLTLEGDVSETSPGTHLSFTGGGTTVIASANNSYTGGTSVSAGTVVFGAVPVVGDLEVTNDAYLGSRASTNLQTGFLDLFNHGTTTGIIGFDSFSAADPVSFDEDIDLTGFDSAVRLGSSSNAVITGAITPQGSTFQFGGRGMLTVTSDLTGPRGLTVDNGLQLFLYGNNSYDGNTYAFNGAVVFGSVTATPASGTLSASSSGYVGHTESTGLNAAQFIAHFETGTMEGVVGFDSDSASSPRTITDNIDLTGFDSGVFIGTSTAVILDSSIIITPANTDYRFTGFRDGQLTVNTVLGGAYNTVIGMAMEDVRSVGSPVVTLNGDNSYTGGTALQSGQLVLGHDHALGTGDLLIAYFGSVPTGLSTNTDNLTFANNVDLGGNHGFTLGGDYNFTMSGDFISTNDSSLLKVGVGNVTLSGDNRGFQAMIEIQSGSMTFASDTAAGGGSLKLDDPPIDGTSEVHFTSNAPVIGSLEGDGNTAVYLDNTGTLTITQNYDATYDGSIVGAGGLTKAGASTLTLNGHSPDYSGTTTLQAGTLFVVNNDSIGTGAVVFNGGRLSVNPSVVLSNPISFGLNGGTLSGTGTIASAVTVGPGVVVSPGNSPGTLTFASTLTFAPGGEYDWQLQTVAGGQGTSTGWDLVSVSTGALDLSTLTSGSFTLKLISLDGSSNPGIVSDFNSSTAYTFTIATAAGGIVGFNSANFTIDASGFANAPLASNFSLSVSGNNLNVNFTPVPEPATWILFGMGALAVVLPAARRRR